MKLTRLAFIGVRGHVDTVMRALPNLPAVRVVGLCRAGCEPLDKLTTWCAASGHGPDLFDDYEVMLDTVRPDAVVVCGPLEDHTVMAIAAMERGIHVLTEKPAAMSLHELARLRAAHEQCPSVHLAALHTSRYAVGFYNAWRLVKAGMIGDVRLINARKSYKIGTRGEFYKHRHTYGGTIPWVGSHAIDWILWISGQPIRSVYAMHSTACNNGLGTLERSAICHFKLAGDRFASVSIDMFRPTRARTHGDDWIRLVGTDGVIEADAGSVSLINADYDENHPVQLLTPPTLFEDFVGHIEGQWQAMNGTEDLFATTAACLLARQSADENRTVDWDEYADRPALRPAADLAVRAR